MVNLQLFPLGSALAKGMLADGVPAEAWDLLWHLDVLS